MNATKLADGQQDPLDAGFEEYMAAMQLEAGTAVNDILEALKDKVQRQRQSRQNQELKYAGGHYHNETAQHAVDAIQALTAIMESTPASTMMELQAELQQASNYIKQISTASLSLASGCEHFLQTVSRVVQKLPSNQEFALCKQALVAAGRALVEAGLLAPERISRLGEQFITDGMRVMTLGCDRTVVQLLKAAAHKRTKHFDVLVAETRPDGAGYHMAKALSDDGIKTTLILDNAVAQAMHRADVVVVGAEAIAENGGIIGRMGTYQMAIVAKAMQKPFYVVVESFKFSRIFPLRQSDLPTEQQPWQALAKASEPLPDNIEVDNPGQDFTPPDLISLLFTEIGVLTPSAVSDELIKLYYHY